jgi:hypothetical protein
MKRLKGLGYLFILLGTLLISSCEDIPGGEGPPEIEFTFIPGLGSSENIQGQVWHLNPEDCRVAVYIRIDVSWWSKPHWSNPVTEIEKDGSWTCDITTGGDDEKANRIVAYLIDKNYSPPRAKGELTLSDDIEKNTLAKVAIDR